MNKIEIKNVPIIVTEIQELFEKTISDLEEKNKNVIGQLTST